VTALSISIFTNNGIDQKWGKGFLLSAFAHLVLISLLIFVPESMPTRRIKGVVYEVDLVELPKLQRSTAKTTTPWTTPELSTIPNKAVPAKRILGAQQEEKPVVMAKRVIERKKHVKESPKVSPTKIIDQTLFRTEPDIGPKEAAPLDQAIPKIESPSVNKSATEASSNQPDTGIAIRLYQMQVENIIKGNWRYATSLRSPGNNKDLMAIVVLLVKNDGTILKTRFKKRSSNALFNQSVLKAIESSIPLPPLPYRKTQDEIEINFNLSDLEGK
jgi:colicin import membrane protein